MRKVDKSLWHQNKEAITYQSLIDVFLVIHYYKILAFPADMECERRK